MTRFQPERRNSHHPARPLSRAHMPSGYEISLGNYTQGRMVRIPRNRGPAQELAGFDPDYRNIVDYIVRITHRIWETDQRDVEYIGDCYAPDSLVYDDYGLQTGSSKIIADTHHTTAAFPDIILDAEEVIWAGDDSIAFHTSHLTRITGTNTGPSRYGDPSGASINVPVIANCVALGNDIFLEHVLYNTSEMLRQLGFDLWEEARRMVASRPAGWPRSPETWDQLRAAASPARPICEAEPIAGFDPDAFARKVHRNVWNGNGSALTSHYDTNLRFEGTTGRKFTGIDAYRGYVAELRAAFPDLELQVDEVYWMGNAADGYLVSTRWSAEGSHGGGGLYRDPTCAPCQVWGITQWRIEDGQVCQEWQLFNEFDLMMQIAEARCRG